MKKLGTLLFILFALCLKAYTQGINFEKGLSWEQIKSKAKRENKYIFLDIYATWCGPCKQMDKEVFTKKNVTDFIKDNFLAVKVQTDSTDWDSDAIKSWRASAAQIKNDYKINVYPSYVFLAPNTQIVHIAAGAMPEEAFLDESKKALNPDAQYSNLLNRYKTGEKSPEFISYLTTRASEVGRKAESRKIAVDYINSLSEQDLYIPENIRILYFNTKTSVDRGFPFFLNNVEEIAKADTSMKPMYIKGLTSKVIIEEEIMPYFRDCDGKPDWKVVRSKLVNKYGKVGEEIWDRDHSGWMFKYEIVPFLKNNPSIAHIEAEFEKWKSDFEISDILFKTVVYYGKSSGEPNADLKMICERVVYFYNSYVERFPDKISLENLNQMAWFIFENSNNESHLTSALKWSRKAIDILPPSVGSNIDTNAMVIDTYANLLFRLAKIQEAIQWEEKAVKLKPESSDFAETLKKMRAGALRKQL